MNGLSDSIAWPTRDPDWLSKVLLMGLIQLLQFIPVVGTTIATLVILGWMLTALDNLRAGRGELPPAGFSYMGRGGSLFVVYLVYGVCLTVVIAVLLGIGIGISVATAGRAGLLGVLFFLFAYALIIVGALGFNLLVPPIIVATERGGIAGGLNLPGVIRMVAADFNSALYAGLFALVASLIGGLGAIACIIGQAFTIPYGYAALAGVVYHYERTATPLAAASPVA